MKNILKIFSIPARLLEMKHYFLGALLGLLILADIYSQHVMLSDIKFRQFWTWAKPIGDGMTANIPILPEWVLWPIAITLTFSHATIQALPFLASYLPGALRRKISKIAANRLEKLANREGIPSSIVVWEFLYLHAETISIALIGLLLASSYGLNAWAIHNAWPDGVPAAAKPIATVVMLLGAEVILAVWTLFDEADEEPKKAASSGQQQQQQPKTVDVKAQKA